MKILIVAKTRRGSSACIGGITWAGKSVRLIAVDAATNERAGLEYNVGEVWEIEATSAPDLIPPHVENVIVRRKRKLAAAFDVEPLLIPFIERYLPPKTGGPAVLYEGLTQATPFGALYIAERTAVPPYSTLFWRPDRPLQLTTEGVRIRYRYPTADGGELWPLSVFRNQSPPFRPMPCYASPCPTGGDRRMSLRVNIVVMGNCLAGFCRRQPARRR